jgi:hypothetical protein
MQGFLYSHPLPAAEFEQALRAMLRVPVSAAGPKGLRLTLE